MFRRSLAHRPHTLSSATPLTPVRGPALRAPACIEQTAQALGAQFERIPQQVTRNVDAGMAQIRTYLGTYLPRTVVEFQTIGQELLSLAAVRESLPRGRTLRVLDIGSGTGGAWMGWAYAMRHALGVQQVDVVATDGNADALGLQAAFLRPISQDLGLGIRWTRVHQRLNLGYAAFMDDLSALLHKVQGQFDFILVSKHLSEFYQAAGHKAQPIVAAALDLLSQRLHTTGSLVLLDVTQKTGDGTEFFAVQLAREVAQYLQTQPQGLRPILPMPCALHSLAGCDAERACFTQREFPIEIANPNTGALECVRSKVSYRVFAHAALAQRVRHSFSLHEAYRVNDQNHDVACVGGAMVSVRRSKNGFTPIERSTAKIPA